jgi:hypothetical protein
LTAISDTTLYYVSKKALLTVFENDWELLQEFHRRALHHFFLIYPAPASQDMNYDEEEINELGAKAEAVFKEKGEMCQLEFGGFLYYGKLVGQNSG